MNPLPALATLAEWLVSQRSATLPADILHTARRCLIDTSGVMLAGASQPVTQNIRQALPLPAGHCRLAGVSQQTDAPTAALINGTAAHALDFDDNCYAGFVHGSAVIVPAALAVAEAEAASGEALLTAVALGSECQYRLGMALNNQLYHAGWWTTGMLGTTGACAAAATLLALDARQCAAALGIAVISASGMKAIFGTDSKPLSAGMAAQRGVMAALLAKAGLSGPVDAIEHPAGLAALCNSQRFDCADLLNSGERWCLRDPGIDIKRIPLCLSSHAAVDALLHLRQSTPFSAEQVERIECDVPEIVSANLIYDRPVSAQQAQFSLPFALAQALIAGDITLSHLEAANLAKPQLQALMARVGYHNGERWRSSEQQRLAPEGAGVTVWLKDGSVHSHFVAKARGAASLPLSDDELSAKFMQCSESFIRRQHAEQLLNRLWRIEQCHTLPDWSTGGQHNEFA